MFFLFRLSLPLQILDIVLAYTLKAFWLWVWLAVKFVGDRLSIYWVYFQLLGYGPKFCFGKNTLKRQEAVSFVIEILIELATFSPDPIYLF